MKAQNCFNTWVVLHNKYQRNPKQGIIRVLFLLLFILTYNPDLKSQVQYTAPDYHQFNITNYNGYFKIGMDWLNVQIETNKQGFYVNNPIFISDLCGKISTDLNITNSLFGTTGIININAGEKINLQSTVYMPFGTSYVMGNTLSQDYPRFLLTHTGVHAYIDYQDNLYFRANKNWISALTLFGNGTVGVGFQTGYDQGDYRNMGYKLAVNGGIICEEVKVIANVPDADYVFEKDYMLMSLSELEAFIQNNKHLPNIPSAEQFKTEGYKIGDMDEMLLRKIEELTLYIIDLEKQINELKETDSKGGE